MITSSTVENGNVRLHVLQKGAPRTDSPSLLIVNGLWEPAERALPLLDGIDRHVVTFSFRGRGASTTPAHGYSLADHLGDVTTVVEHTGLRSFHLLGFSRGAAYAMAWALEHQPEHDLRGLILVDQAPVHRAIGPEQAEFWKQLVYRGLPITSVMRPEAIDGLAADAVEIGFADRLAELTVPVTLFQGRDTSSPIPSDLTDDTLATYRAAVTDLTVVPFAASGHMIPDDQPAEYLAAVQGAITR